MNNFCVLPFNSISIGPTGSLRPCCNAYATYSKLSIDDLSLEEVLNNNKNMSLRQEFLDDKQDILCDRCWQMENIGNRSFRQAANASDYGLKSTIPIKKETHISFDDIQYLDLTLGNKCNLACRMCNHFSSSLLAKQLIELKKHSGNYLIEHSESTKNKILELIDKATNLNTIYLLGGEPLINEFHDQILNRLVESNRSHKISLKYSTNLNSDIEKYFELWSKFQNIFLTVSIDGEGSTYEYIRWPGRWEKVYNNFLRAYEFKQRNNFSPTIATTVQNINANNIFDLVTTFYNDKDPVPFFFIPVTGGNYLELTPKHILADEIKKLEKLNDPFRRISELIRHYHDSMNKHDSITSSQVIDFFAKQKMFDQYRQQNLFKTMPYFVELAEKFNVDTW